MLTLFLVIAAILLLSGFFSCSEAALISITQADVETLVEKKRFGSKALSRVQERIESAVIAIVVMNNIVNIVGSITVGQIVITLYGDAFLAITTTGLTFGVIIFSEIIPKSIGIHYAHGISCLVAPIIWLFITFLSPVIWFLEHITNLFKRGERKVGTEEQIRSLVSIGRREGHIETDEGQLIHRAFILNDKKAGDIMSDLKDIVGVSVEMTVAEAWEKIQTDPHSRYPVFGASINDIEGIVFRVEILEALKNDQADTAITTLMKDTLIVERTAASDDLLRLFRDKQKHLAVVQDDEHTVGIVTLEDVLEELVGEIEDEADAVE